MASFCNERTVEYAMTSYLKTALSNDFQAVIPFYFWASREGSPSARLNSDRQLYRMIAMFARRPKYSGIKSAIRGKINVELEAYALAASKRRIPAFAAFPLVSTLVDLAREPDFFLLPLGETGGELEFTVDLSAKPPAVWDDDCKSVRLVDVPELVDRVMRTTVPAPYEDFVDAIKEIRTELHYQGTGYFGLIGGYKPVYLLLS